MDGGVLALEEAKPEEFFQNPKEENAHASFYLKFCELTYAPNPVSKAVFKYRK